MDTYTETLYPFGMSATEWYEYCRSRQRELFPRDGELLRYAKDEPLAVSVGDVLRAKGWRVAS